MDIAKHPRPNCRIGKSAVLVPKEHPMFEPKGLIMFVITVAVFTILAGLIGIGVLQVLKWIGF